MYLFAKNDADSGKPASPANCRFYFLKIWQDGNLVRNYRPVRLKNGLVVLWDFVENKAYPARSVAAPYTNYTIFPVVGPDGAKIVEGTILMVR